MDLSERRKAAKERLEQYKAMKALLEPFEDPKESVQGNLVGRNGEVERELERMRMLMLRVERGVEGLDGVEEGQEGDIDMDIDVDPEGEEERRVQAGLGG